MPVPNLHLYSLYPQAVTSPPAAEPGDSFIQSLVASYTELWALPKYLVASHIQLFCGHTVPETSPEYLLISGTHRPRNVPSIITVTQLDGGVPKTLLGTGFGDGVSTVIFAGQRPSLVFWGFWGRSEKNNNT